MIILYLVGMVWIFTGYSILQKEQQKIGKIINKFPNVESPFWSSYCTGWYYMACGPFAELL